MSGLATPPSKKITYHCRTCSQCCWITQYSLDAYSCNGTSLSLMHPISGVPTRCTPCATIVHAARALRDLVVQKPYLVSDGMAAAPLQSEWEIKGLKEKWDRNVESLGDGMDEKERREFVRRVVRSFEDTAGQGLTEEEVYGAGEKGGSGRESRANTQVEEEGDPRGEEWDGKTQVDERGSAMNMEKKFD